MEIVLFLKPVYIDYPAALTEKMTYCQRLRCYSEFDQ